MENKNNSFFFNFIKLCLSNRVIVISTFTILLLAGIFVAPFDWSLPFVERNPVSVDAIPNIGANQQIVFTKWPGHSPQDIEDQITYPLSISLMGVPGVKEVRAKSMFGFSMINIIFKEDIEFYWSRTRILEKLNSLSSDTIPDNVQPKLGPDSTALGQIFWYTIEPRQNGKTYSQHWSLEELRSIQDWIVKYELLSVEGVSEVASIGGYEKEYHIDVDPAALKAFDISIKEVFDAIKNANDETSANNLVINKVEYIIRGLGYFKNITDIKNTVIKQRKNVPVYVKNLAEVRTGPAERRGILDKGGQEAVGGVVVVRHGKNPLEVINKVKKKINNISTTLPSKKLSDGTKKSLEINSFYDRTGLIYKTLQTLNSGLTQEIIITIIVILLMISSIQMAGIISAILPASVLLCFLMMKFFNIEANIVALSGIVIAIGTVVDMGIVLCENIYSHFKEAYKTSKIKIISQACSEVAGPVLTSVSTTIISFLPVFTLQYSAGKLFKPLAFTKTFTLLAAIIITLTLVPVLAYYFMGKQNNGYDKSKKDYFRYINFLILIAGVVFIFYNHFFIGTIFISYSLLIILLIQLKRTNFYLWIKNYQNYLWGLLVTYLLTLIWSPLGPDKGVLLNFAFILAPVIIILGLFKLYQHFYPSILMLCIKHKKSFLSIIIFILIFGIFSWIGVKPVFNIFPKNIKNSRFSRSIISVFPGMQSEFMPTLNEGSFLFMPSTMPHASITEVKDILQKQDKLITSIPEVELAVGKAGRAKTALDPAPLSMIETIINYKSEFIKDSQGNIITYKYDEDKIGYVRNKEGEKLSGPNGKPYKIKGKFIRNENGELIRDKYGHPFRQWRPALKPSINEGREYWKGIKDRDDIWSQIVKVTSKIPGSTVPSKLQPIETRLLMLESGLRSPLGLKVKGNNLDDIRETAFALENILKQVDAINSETVYAQKVIGKPYLEFEINRRQIARYGVSLEKVQNIIEIAVGGKKATTMVEGRERYSIRVRYKRELRQKLDNIKRILVTGKNGEQVPVGQLVELKYRKGPRSIRSENASLISYVFFDAKENFSSVAAVNEAKNLINKKINSGKLELPKGSSYQFAGDYKKQIRTAKRLRLVVPLAIMIIFLFLYMQFKSFYTCFLVFSSIITAWAGGFIFLWLYSAPWFMNFTVLGIPFREVLNIHQINLSVAVWVGFLALFGIATDNGVVMASYLNQSFTNTKVKTIKKVYQKVIEAGQRRIRPCLMTTGTTLLALIPILTSTGKGSNIMIPMAIPIFGGMLFAVITTLIIPVLYAGMQEKKVKKNQ